MPKHQRQPTQAIALKWHPGVEKAPKVTAKGRGSMAEEILRLAHEHGIPIREDADMVQVLSLLEQGDSIPPAIYDAIAEILVFIYWSNQQYEEFFNSL